MREPNSRRILGIKTVTPLESAEPADPRADAEQGGYALTAEVRNQKHQADQGKKRKNIGFKVLALREVIQAAVALRPGDSGQQSSDQRKQKAAEREKLSRRANWGGESHSVSVEPHLAMELAL
jgi:hypothetical protein